MTRLQRQERLTIIANVEDAIAHLTPMAPDETDLALAAWGVAEARARLGGEDAAAAPGDLARVDQLLDMAMRGLDELVRTLQNQRFVGRMTAA